MKTILLTNSNEVALVSDHRYDLAMTRRWCWKQGYVYSTCKPRVFLHVFIFGKAPHGFEWDHRNRNKLDNTDGNLRTATKAQNNANREKQHDNRSGYIGVHRHRGTKLWRAEFSADGKRVQVGYFKSKVAAAKARDVVAFSRWGEFANLNFPSFVTPGAAPTGGGK